MTVSCNERFAEGSRSDPWLVSLVLGENGRKVIYSLVSDEITLAEPDRIQPIAYGANVGRTQILVDRNDIALEVCGHGPNQQMRSLENLRDWRRKTLPRFCHLNTLNNSQNRSPFLQSERAMDLHGHEMTPLPGTDFDLSKDWYCPVG